MPTQAGWASDCQGFYAAKRSRIDLRFHLVVERLPGRGWDWLVWSADRKECCRYGKADTAEEAKHAAEYAVMLVGGMQEIFSVRPAATLYVLH